MMEPNEGKVFMQKEDVELDNGTHSSWILYLSAFAANILLITGGAMRVWPSTVIPKLMSNDTEINPLGRPITSLETSLIVSLTPLSIVFGFLMASKPADIVGRKRSILCYAIIIFCCLIAIAFAKNIYVYYVCFSLFGITLAATIATVVVYNTEIAEDKNRTWLSCCITLSQPFGELCGFALGAMIDSIEIFTLLTSVPILVHFLLYNFTVESPVYLVYKNKKALALKTLKKLRTHNDFAYIQKEYKSIEEAFINNGDKKVTLFDLFGNHKLRKAFFIISLIMFTQAVAGIYVIYAYMGLIFKEAGAILSGKQIGVAAGCVNVAGVLLIILIINRFGRRRLLLLSSLFCSISLTGVAFYFYIKEIESPIVDYIRWLPVIFILLFITSYTLGLESIPTGYIGEIFPNELRATCVSAVLIFSSLISFGLDFVFPLMAENFGISFSMFFHSILTFIGFSILYFCLPETRGQSFKQIQLMLEKKIFSFDL